MHDKKGNIYGFYYQDARENPRVFYYRDTKYPVSANLSRTYWRSYQHRLLPKPKKTIGICIWLTPYLSWLDWYRVRTNNHFGLFCFSVLYEELKSPQMLSNSSVLKSSFPLLRESNARRVLVKRKGFSDHVMIRREMISCLGESSSCESQSGARGREVMDTCQKVLDVWMDSMLVDLLVDSRRRPPPPWIAVHDSAHFFVCEWYPLNSIFCW